MSSQNTDDIDARIQSILAEQAMLDLTDVTNDSTLEDLGIDSLGIVEVIFSIEETFDVSVPFNANEPEKSDFDISSVGAIANAVRNLVNEQSK